MALVTIDDVQIWLEVTKHRIAPDDQLPEESAASEVVLSRLAVRFDTTTWVDPASTPSLVRKIIAMLVASWRYNRVYSETDEDAGNPYANKLEQRANDLITAILEGSIALTDVGTGPAIDGTVDFYPTDISTATDSVDDKGRVFTMGKVF